MIGPLRTTHQEGLSSDSSFIHIKKKQGKAVSAFGSCALSGPHLHGNQRDSYHRGARGVDKTLASGFYPPPLFFSVSPKPQRGV